MPNRETALSQGETLLSEWSLPADAGVEQLRELLGRDPAADLALAARLGGIAEQSSLEALLALEKSTADKLVRKEVRRALYRLSQRGLSLPSSAPAPKATPLVAPAPPEGYVSAIDGGGDQLVWLLKPMPGGLAHVFAVINDPHGLKEVNLAETTRKALRAARQALWEKHELRMVECDWRYCDFLVDRAFRWASERGETVSGDWPGLRAQLIKQPVSEMQPLIFERLDVEAVRGDQGLVEESRSLVEEPELRTWFLDPDEAKPYVEEMVEARSSPLVLNEVQQQERLRGLVERAIAEVFGGERQASWVRRLQEMAFFFHATGRVEPAKQALAAALALQQSSRGGRGIGVCEQIAGRSLAAYWQIQSERESEQSRSSLVVTPQQAVREAEQRRRS
jgi:hypothetical protein